MATAAKKPVKKASASKKTVKKSAPRAVAAPQKSEFMQTKFTEQSVYWIIIGMAVVGLAMWVLALQVQLNKVYDAMDVSASNVILPGKKSQ